MKIYFSFVLLFCFINSSAQSVFLNQQKRYPRVREAIKTKNQTITTTLRKNNIKLDQLQIILVAYKNSSLLDVYAKQKRDTYYKKIKTYTICEKSGILGPKRKQGDQQVPEGFYHINRYNPMSLFHLSIGINYPNASDRIKSTATNLGGDIFIHGYCATIGCLPMTDDKIKEIYLYTIHAKNNGQAKIPVYIFPFKMTDDNFNFYTQKHKNNTELIEFWSNLKAGHDRFLKTKKQLNYSIGRNGQYLFNK